MVTKQLQRPLRGSWQVAARCHLGLPTVIENHPRLEDGSPFPTLFWLTCPLLVKRVSRLEAAGKMQEINAALAAGDRLRADLAASMAALTARRDEHEVLSDAAPPGGGPDRVKCLHAHVASELAMPGDPVGARTLAVTGWPDCVEGCVG